MSSTRKPPSRRDLAQFIRDPETIRKFENLFDDAGEAFPEEIAALQILVQEVDHNAYNAISSAEQALSALEEIKQISNMDALSQYAQSMEELKKAIENHEIRLEISPINSIEHDSLLLLSPPCEPIRRVDSDLDIKGSVSCPNNEYNGIKIDNVDPVFSWLDLPCDACIFTPGVSDPTLSTYIGSIKQYQFQVNDEVYHQWHIPHDYVKGSDLYLQVHWSHNFTTVTGGNITFTVESTVSRGYDQAAFHATKSVTLTDDASTIQYRHMTGETQISASGGSGTLLDSDILEPGAVILSRFYLSANNITVSGGGVPDPFVHKCNLYYQSKIVGTKNREPPFY